MYSCLSLIAYLVIFSSLIIERREAVAIIIPANSKDSR